MASVTNRRLHLLLVILWFGTLSCATLLGETPVPLATIAPTVAPATPTLGAISVITTPTSTTEPITMPTRRPTPTDTPTPEPLIPGAIACPAGGNNLLVNPSFEGNFRAQGNDAIIVADGWIAWWLRGSATSQQPDYQQATSGNRVHSGGSAQQLYKRQAQYQGGVYQIVENAQITAGTHVQFSIWGQGFSCAEGADCNQGLSVDPANMFMRVGIDPTGNLDPNAGTVRWSSYFNPIDGYQIKCVDAVASSGKITVFTWSSPDKVRLQQETFWDDGALVILP